MPDGKTRGWSRIDVERPDLTQHYPFIIQHDSTGEERRFASLVGHNHLRIRSAPEKFSAPLSP